MFLDRFILSNKSRKKQSKRLKFFEDAKTECHGQMFLGFNPYETDSLGRTIHYQIKLTERNVREGCITNTNYGRSRTVFSMNILK